MTLFPDQERTPIHLPLPDAEIIYYPSYFSSELSDRYFQQLFNKTEWQHDNITVFGKTYAQPRLTALYGVDGKSYSYSGITMTPQPFTTTLQEIKKEVERVSTNKFSTVLLNLYRDGADSNGWHSDDEKELGQNPEIASVSFGVKRVFHLKHKSDSNIKHSIELEHGSLLIMRGATQHYWKHQLPKSKRIHDPRINLTFRTII